MEFFEIANIADYAFVNDVYKHYLWAYLVIGACCFAVTYVFKSVGLYVIARREGFKNRWMAFVPFLNTYYIGVLSDKNKIFRAKASQISLAAALVEVAYVALSIVYYVAVYLIFKDGYAAPEYSTVMVGGNTIDVPNGNYYPVNIPASLNWAWWVFANMQDYVIYFVQLAFMLLELFVLISFFRTYASPRYVLFSLLCIFFPIQGILIFAVRNNRGKNYQDYLREQRQRQYVMYQEYMRGTQNGPGGSYGDPYAQQQRPAPPEDPFGGLGSSDGGNKSSGGNNGSSDPFDEL